VAGRSVTTNLSILTLKPWAPCGGGLGGNEGVRDLKGEGRSDVNTGGWVGGWVAGGVGWRGSRSPPTCPFEACCAVATDARDAHRSHGCGVGVRGEGAGVVLQGLCCSRVTYLQRHRLCELDSRDAHRPDGSAHLPAEHAPVVGPAQFHVEDGVELDREFGLLDDSEG
jgi:hypothetical protein